MEKYVNVMVNPPIDGNFQNVKVAKQNVVELFYTQHVVILLTF